MHDCPRCTEARRLLDQVLNAQGHDQCWWHPELVQRLAQLFEVRHSCTLRLPPIDEFHRECRKFARTLYQPEYYL